MECDRRWRHDSIYGLSHEQIVILSKYDGYLFCRILKPRCYMAFRYTPFLPEVTMSTAAVETSPSYADYVNPQWVRLLDLLQMNVRYTRCVGVELHTADGGCILDFLSGYCVHNHPAIIAALKADSLHSGDGAAELVLGDNGPGFPPDISARAFERFVKGKHSPGHGLGLAFVDAVVQSHGGYVKISDGPQGGAVMSVSLPLSVLQPA
jgi:hypothetical protein